MSLFHRERQTNMWNWKKKKKRTCGAWSTCGNHCLLFVIKYANFWRPRCLHRRLCLRSLFTLVVCGAEPPTFWVLWHKVCEASIWRRCCVNFFCVFISLRSATDWRLFLSEHHAPLFATFTLTSRQFWARVVLLPNVWLTRTLKE